MTIADDLHTASDDELFAMLTALVRRAEPLLLEHLRPAGTWSEWLGLSKVAEATLRGLWAPGEVARMLEQGTTAELAQEAGRRLLIVRPLGVSRG